MMSKPDLDPYYYHRKGEKISSVAFKCLFFAFAVIISLFFTLPIAYRFSDELCGFVLGATLYLSALGFMIFCFLGFVAIYNFMK